MRSSSSPRRREKFRYSRSLPSFSEYLLIEPDVIRVELYVRQPDDSWILRELTGPDAEIRLDSIGCRLTLRCLYAKVNL